MRGRNSSASIIEENSGFHRQPTRGKSQPENALKPRPIAEKKIKRFECGAHYNIAVITPTRILFRLSVFLFIGWEFKIKGRFGRIAFRSARCLPNTRTVNEINLYAIIFDRARGTNWIRVLR